MDKTMSDIMNMSWMSEILGTTIFIAKRGRPVMLHSRSSICECHCSYRKKLDICRKSPLTYGSRLGRYGAGKGSSR